MARRQADEAVLLSCLNGNSKHLVRGNNDPAATGEAAGWASVGNYAELTERHHWLLLCHYPVVSWNDQHCHAINLHGHGKLKPMLRKYDVGVDARNFRPVRLVELLAGRIVPLPPAGHEVA